MLDARFLSTLVCPLCHNQVMENNGLLQCSKCKYQCNINNDIPDFTDACGGEDDISKLKIQESYLNYLNLQKVGIFYIPYVNYDVMKLYLKKTPSFFNKLLIKFHLHHPAVIKSIKTHHKLFDIIHNTIEADSKKSLYETDYIKYLELYGYKPFLAYFKFLEGQLFRHLSDTYFGENTMEIGVSDSKTSNLHFFSKYIEFGTDYTGSRLHSGLHRNKYLFSSSAKALPIKSNCMKSVFLVHIFDDLNFDIKYALQEINRVLIDGGYVIFSCSNDKYVSHQTHNKISKLIRMSKNDFEKYKKMRYPEINILTKDELNLALISTGFEIVEYIEFQDIEHSWLWDIGLTIEVGNGKIRYHKLEDESSRKHYIDHIIMSLDKLYNDELRKSQDGILDGMHYLCIAKKNDSSIKQG